MANAQMPFLKLHWVARTCCNLENNHYTLSVMRRPGDVLDADRAGWMIGERSYALASTIVFNET